MRRLLILIMAAKFAVAPAFPQKANDRVAPEDANEARLNRLQPPDKVMDIIGAAPGMRIAEIGAGRGRYVVHLADRVGPTGKVYAEDIDEAALRHCAERCRRNGFDNVETILGGFTDPRLPANTLDLIFVISSYHHFSDSVALMKNARPALKPTGGLAIAEWVRQPGGPGEGTSPETMKSKMEDAGFVLQRIDKTFENNRMYIYLFRPRPVDRPPVLKGPNQGQKSPGMIPEIFAPGVVSRDGIQTKLTMSADGSQILYAEQDPAFNSMIFIIRSRAGDSWGEPVVLPYSRGFMNMEPSLAPDGTRIVFVSNRPRNGSGDPEKAPDLWMAEKTGDGWGNPVRLGPPICADDAADVEAHPFFGPDGGLYFLRQSAKIRRLFHAARRGDRFDEPVPLPLEEDLFAGQFSGPSLSPEGRILLMHSRKDGGFGNWDLYAAFKDESGTWSAFVNLGPAVNTAQAEGSAFFSPDGRFFVLHPGRGYLPGFGQAHRRAEIKPSAGKQENRG